MGKISVIMPAYNTEKYIKRSINSVLSQTYSNLELIIINDGSSDGTEQIILEFKKRDDRIKYFKIKNSGSAVARNIGLDNVTGKYIAFVDSDDYIDKNMFEILMSKMNKFDCDIVSCSFNKVYTNKVTEEITYLGEGLYDKKRLKEEFYPSLIANKFLIKGVVPLQMVTKLYKNSLIKENNLKFIPKLRMGQDMEFSRKTLLYANSLYYLPHAKLYNYVHNKSSRTQTYLNNAWKIIKEGIQQSIVLSNEFPEYNLQKQIPFTYISGAMTAIANVGMHPNDVSRKTKINEIKEIINDNEVQVALQNVDTKKFQLRRRILVFMIKNKFVYPIYFATFFYRRK